MCKEDLNTQVIFDLVYTYSDDEEPSEDYIKDDLRKLSARVPKADIDLYTRIVVNAIKAQCRDGQHYSFDECIEYAIDKEFGTN